MSTELLVIKDVPKIDVGEICALAEGGVELLEQTKQAVEQDIDSQGKCDAMNVAIGKLKKIVKFIEDVRKKNKAPYWEGGKAVDAQCKEVAEPVGSVIFKGSQKVLAWDKEVERLHAIEVKRIADENAEAERKAKAEEERRKNISLGLGGKGEITPVKEPEKIAPPAPISHTRSTQYRENIVVEVKDVLKVPQKYLVHPKVAEAVRQVVQAAVNDTVREAGGAKKINIDEFIEIPGVQIKKEKTRVH